MLIYYTIEPHSEKWALDRMLAGLRHNAMNNVKSPGDHISFRLSLTPRMSPVFTQTFPRNGMVLCGHSSCTLECCVLYVWGYLPLRGESLQRIKLLPAHAVFRTPVEEHSACALLHLFEFRCRRRKWCCVQCNNKKL